MFPFFDVRFVISYCTDAWNSIQEGWVNNPNIYAGLFGGELDWIRQLQEAHRIYLRCEMVIVK